MARALPILFIASLSAVLVSRGYANCVDAWNSRLFRPDTVSALSICMREDPVPLLTALFAVVTAFVLSAPVGRAPALPIKEV